MLRAYYSTKKIISKKGGLEIMYSSIYRHGGIGNNLNQIWGTPES